MILEASPVKHNQIGVRRLNMAGAYVPELYVEKQQISIKNLFNLRKVLFALKCATIHVQQANQYFKFSLGQTTVSQYSLHISTSRSMHLRATQRTLLALREPFKYYFADFVRKGGGGGTPQIRNPLFAKEKIRKGGEGGTPQIRNLFFGPKAGVFEQKTQFLALFEEKFSGKNL